MEVLNSPLGSNEHALPRIQPPLLILSPTETFRFLSLQTFLLLWSLWSFHAWLLIKRRMLQLGCWKLAVPLDTFWWCYLSFCLSVCDHHSTYIIGLHAKEFISYCTPEKWCTGANFLFQPLLSLPPNKQTFLANSFLQKLLLAVWDAAITLPREKPYILSGLSPALFQGGGSADCNLHTPSTHFAGQFFICRSLKCLLLSDCLNKLPDTLCMWHCWHLLLVLAINHFILSWSSPTGLMRSCAWWLRKALSFP